MRRQLFESRPIRNKNLYLALILAAQWWIVVFILNLPIHHVHFKKKNFIEICTLQLNSSLHVIYLLQNLNKGQAHYFLVNLLILAFLFKKIWFYWRIEKGFTAYSLNHNIQNGNEIGSKNVRLRAKVKYCLFKILTKCWSV